MSDVARNQGQQAASEQNAWSPVFTNEFANLLPFPIFCKDPLNDFAYTVWNRAHEQVTEINADGILGKTDLGPNTWDGTEQMKESDNAAIERREVIYLPEVPISTPSGKEVVLRVWKIPIFADDGAPRLLACICQDITESIRAERLINEQRSKLAQAARLASLGELAGGIAHEINTPLNTILLLAENALAAAERSDLPEVGESIGTLCSSVDRISKIITGMKSLCRDASADPFADVIVEHVLSESLALCQQRMNSAGVKSRVTGETKARVRARAAELCQVFFNLLTNSCEALQGQIDGQIDIAIESAGQSVSVFISDNGPGVPAEIRQKIFEPFFTSKQAAFGAGLGLSQASTILHHHGGSLTLENSNHGARFRLTLPAAR